MPDTPVVKGLLHTLLHPEFIFTHPVSPILANTRSR